MLLIESKMLDIQRAEGPEMAPASIRRLSRTYDYLEGLIGKDTEED